MQVDLDFRTWKRLTALLVDERDTYDAVISRLLSSEEKALIATTDTDPEPLEAGARPTGAYFKEVFLPDGTALRATHKGKTYFAKISGSEWIDEASGEKRSSPSQAAYFITNNHVNGWLFWLVRRPEDSVWHSLNALRSRNDL
jgi:hypothetical protein